MTPDEYTAHLARRRARQEAHARAVLGRLKRGGMPHGAALDWVMVFDIDHALGRTKDPEVRSRLAALKADIAMRLPIASHDLDLSFTRPG